MNSSALTSLTSLPLLVEAQQLNEALATAPGKEKILPVAVIQESAYATCHIPGSVLIRPAELLSGIKPAVGKLPDVQQLKEVFSRIGLTDDTHVVAYDDEGGGWAGRLIWTLDIIGHRNYSYLNGGIHAWLKLGLALTGGLDNDDRRTDYSLKVDKSAAVDKEEILEQIGNPDFLVWDARGADEYSGVKVTAQRNGHIPGAVNLDWLELMDRENDLRLKPLQLISQRLEALGINKDRKIVTHCQTHHRSGLTYLVGKILGFDIRAYDGSWSEWGNDADTPIEN